MFATTISDCFIDVKWRKGRRGPSAFFHGRRRIRGRRVRARGRRAPDRPYPFIRKTGTHPSVSHGSRPAPSRLIVLHPQPSGLSIKLQLSSCRIIQSCYYDGEVFLLLFFLSEIDEFLWLVSKYIFIYSMFLSCIQDYEPTLCLIKQRKDFLSLINLSK